MYDQDNKRKSLRIAVVEMPKTQTFFYYDEASNCGRPITIQKGESVLAELMLIDIDQTDGAHIFQYPSKYIWIHLVKRPDIKLLINGKYLNEFSEE